MNKLTLNLDALKVQTFETAPEIVRRGTVVGAADALLMGTRVTRCYSECTACTNTEGLDCNC